MLKKLSFLAALPGNVAQNGARRDGVSLHKLRAASFALLTLSLVWVLSAQNGAQAVIENSMKAHGVSEVKTLTVYGDGADGFVGQVWDPKADFWRRYFNRDLVRGYDFEAKAYRTKRTRGEGNNPPGGGAGTTTPAPTQEQDQITQANNFNGQIEMAMTPIGFLKFAAANSATVSQRTENGKRYTVLSVAMDVPGQTPYKTTVNGYINPQGLVEKVNTMIHEAFLGDIKWEATFTNYKDFGGVKFPANIVQRQYEPKIFELAVSDVKINQPVDLTPPAGKGKGGPGGGKGGAPKGGAAAAKGKGGPGAGKGGGGPLGPEDLGNGFWLIRDGYGAIVADFRDYIVVVEGPQNYERGATIIAEAKRLIPNKPIRYVINTHSHFDHTSGLRPFVAEGATIITHNNNKGYYEKTLANPHTLVPDPLEMMNPKPKVKVEYVGDKKVFTDGTHTIETYHLKGSTHSNNMLIVYLPQQKLLLEGDEYNVPGQATAAPVANPNSYQVNLLTQIEKLKIDVQRIVPVHLPGDNRAVSIQELRYMAGRAQ